MNLSGSSRDACPAIGTPMKSQLVRSGSTGDVLQGRGALSAPGVAAGAGVLTRGGSRWSGGRFTYSAEISVAEESDKDDDHERREEKELAPGEHERQGEPQ